MNADANDARKRLILCTVGISLEEKCKEPGHVNITLGIYKEIFGDNGILNKYEATSILEAERNGGIFQSLEKIINRYVEFWNNNVDEKLKKEASPAELASLSGRLNTSGEAEDGDAVVLLCSNTAKGVFCGLFVKLFVENMGWAKCGLRAKFSDGELEIVSSTESALREDSASPSGDDANEQAVGNLLSCGGLVMVDGLAIADTRQFEEIGLANLVSCMSLLIESAKEKGMVVEVNATGGFKPQSIYATIIGSLFEVDVYYLHEDSQENLKLPPLPIDHDAMSWAEYIGIIEAADGKDKDRSVALKESLPEPYRRLFQERGGKLFLNPFGSIVRGRMKEETKRLSRYGRGLLLTERLGDYKEKYEKCVTEAWQYLWLGDLIPETVEHARGHTQRLLTLASQLLLPLYGQNNKPPLTEVSLFALLASIWLHDLGHKQRELKIPKDKFEVPGSPEDPVEIVGEMNDWSVFRVSGLPTVVRDMHHVLTWEALLLDKSDRYKLKSLRFPVAWACLFHRLQMPLGNDSEFKDKVTGFTVRGPMANVIKVKADGEVCVEVKKVAALLRFLDACDVQRERTVDERYLEERMDLTLGEMEEEEGKREELAKALAEASKSRGGVCREFQELNYILPCFTKKARELNEFLRKIIKNDKGEGGNKNFVELIDGFDCLKRKIEDNLKKLISREKNLFLSCSEKKEDLLFRSWLESADRAFFKALQVYHFIKHYQVSQVLILPEDGGRFKVEIKPTEKFAVPGILEKIKGDIEAEYSEVREILKGLGINSVEVAVKGDIAQA